MLVIIFLFFIAVVGIGTYVIAIKARRRTSGQKRQPGRVTDHATVERATGTDD